MVQKNNCLTSPVMDKNLLAPFSPLKIGKILPTSNKPILDVFESYKPRKEQCLDYKISQTYANFQKGDLKCNVEETCATYKPLSPKDCKKVLKKSKRFSGGPPQYHFINEIWLKKREELQKKAVAKIKQATIEKKHNRIRRKLKEHEIVQRLVGPEWFMELSPKQLDAIDELQSAIEEDINNCSVVETQQIVAILGLVLRPNQRHLEIALRHSCRSSIEFLLVLYHLLDPNRNMYSLNDRLILSAVVHLAITDTLKELHIRIPSPPNRTCCNMKRRKVLKKKKPINQKRFKSPYLFPQTFYPPPPKFTGIYKNKHLQYPESRYFAYLSDMEIEKKENKTDVKDLRNYLSSDEKEMLKEYEEVQSFYDLLPGAIDAKKLLPARRIKICLNMLNKTAHKKLPCIHLYDVASSDDEEFCCNCKKKRLVNSLENRKCHGEDFIRPTEKKFPCDKCLESQRIKNNVRIIGAYVGMSCKCDHVPVIQGISLPHVCDCVTAYKKRVAISSAQQCFIASGKKYVIAGVIMSKLGPIYNLVATLGDSNCSCIESQNLRKFKCNEQLKLRNSDTKFSVNGVFITNNSRIYVLGNAVARKSCGCIKKYRDSLIVSKAQDTIKQCPAKFINFGVVNNKQFGPVYSLAGACDAKIELKCQKSVNESSSDVIIQPKCVKKCITYLKYEDVLKYESTTSNENKCKMTTDDEQVPNKINNENEHSETQTEYTSSSEDDEDCCSCSSSGSETSRSNFYCSYCTMKNQEIVKNQSNENSSSNPSSFKCQEGLDRFLEKKCQCEDCLVNIRQGYATHIYGGTKTTESGNALNFIQGIHQPQCNCMHNYLEKIKQAEEYKSRALIRYKTMKNVEKYLISGVIMTKDGPVYNIAGITPSMECDCKKKWDEEYQQSKSKVLNTGTGKFNVIGVKQLSKENVFILANAMKTEECECMKILRKFEEEHTSCVDEFDQFLIRIKEEQERENSCSVTSDEITKVTQALEVQTDYIEEENEETPNENQLKTEESCSESSSGYCDCCKEELENSSDYTTSDESSETSSDAERNTSCSLKYADHIKPISLKEKQIPEYLMSKRYAIFKKLPSCPAEQEMILKYILEGMAQDGFALAQLPEVYKLPIFQLWWKMRSEVYWTQSDKQNYVNTSIQLWNHTDFCYKEPEVDNLTFTQNDLRKLTWANAKMIRDITSKFTYSYYRKVKQVSIATGREFFASTFDYEFPTPGWRDCAFAYVPTKEEAVFPYKVYQSHDAKHVPSNKRLKCKL